MSELTLMAVHAHPDDEAIATGGVLHKYSLEGVQTILVTCTGGELGDGPGPVKPGEPGHDPGQVKEMRAAELQASCQSLGISHLEMLGYHDSGMEGWDQNRSPEAFSRQPLTEEIGKLSQLIRQYRPQVMVTYAADGGYGHPDHVRAHQVAKGAWEETGIPAKLYYSTFRKSTFRKSLAALKNSGLDLSQLPPMDFDPMDPPFGVEDDQISTFIDVSADVQAKIQSLKAHSSQADNGWLLKMPEAAVTGFFAEECFILAEDRLPSSLPEDDLFSGLR